MVEDLLKVAAHDHDVTQAAFARQPAPGSAFCACTSLLAFAP